MFAECFVKVYHKLCVVPLIVVVFVDHVAPSIPLYRQRGIITESHLHLQVRDIVGDAVQFPAKTVILIIKRIHGKHDAAQRIKPLVDLKRALRGHALGE